MRTTETRLLPFDAWLFAGMAVFVGLLLWNGFGQDARPPAEAQPRPLPGIAATPSATALHQMLPPSGTWRYDVLSTTKGLPYRASATLDWRHDDKHYEAHMAVSAFLIGSRTQTSTGSLANQGLIPDLFVDQTRKRRTTRFEHGSQTLHFSTTGLTQALLKGAQDRLSVLLQLAAVLNGAPAGAYPPPSWSAPVAGTSGSETWFFEFQGTEQLDLPAGLYEAHKYTRKARHPGDQQVEVWLAPSLQHIPVRLRISHANGDVVDQRLAAP